MTIDYEALAAAILRAGAEGNAAVCTQNSKMKAGTVVEVPKSPGEEKSESVGSWADAVEEEERATAEALSVVSSSESVSSGSVKMPADRPVISSDARVVFGGLSDCYKVEQLAVTPGQAGYYKTVVRGPNAVALRKRVEQLCGAKIPKAGHESLALCTFTAGTMPTTVVSGKDRLRTLAAVGDAALTLALATHEWSMGRGVESSQGLRTRKTNNQHLCSVVAKYGLGQFVSYAPGVDARTTIGSATALEAMIGVVALYRSPSILVQFLTNLGFME